MFPAFSFICMGLRLASAFTLALLGSFLFAVIVGLMLFFEVVSLTVAVGAVIVVNLLVWLVSPRINDFMYRYLYDMRWVTLEELRSLSPESARVVERVTDDYGYSTPKFGIIHDRNPNAFTYGSGRWNSRIFMTEGCFEFLDDEEVASVMAHELGHVTNRDFIVMTIANTVVQILYLIAIYSWRFGQRGRNRAATALFGIAVLSYIFYFVGEYMVLYLSRVREYYADEFAAEYTDPDAMSTALVKVAYGILVTDEDKELVNATKNIGLMNPKTSRDEGLAYHNSGRSVDAESALAQSFLFDLKNPWARLGELRSTHPLTGKRVKRLSKMSVHPVFDFDEILRRNPIDMRRMYREFLTDVGALFLPTLVAVGFPLIYLGAAVAQFVALDIFLFAGGWLAVVGVALLARNFYKYPRGEAEDETVLGLLADPYASPVRGKNVSLDGELIGRGQAGYRLSEDLMFKDETGLMYLRYESWLPVLGNLFFAVSKVPDLVGEKVEIDGWFLRGTSQHVAMLRLRAPGESVKSYVHISGLVLGALLLVIGVAVLGIGVAVV